MKKIFTILACAVTLLSGMMFVGCTEEDKDLLMGPEGVWCDMPITYKNSEGGEVANLYVYCIYTSTDITSTSTGASYLKNGTTIPAGITFVVTAKTDQSSVISGLTEGQYVMKNFPLNGDADYESDDDGSDSTKITFKANRAWWTALYYLKADLRKSDHQSVNPPAGLTNGGYKAPLTWDTVKAEFSWKRLLANYLLQ